MDDYEKFITETILLLMKLEDTLMDELNLHTKYFKGVDILTYYILQPYLPNQRQRTNAEENSTKKVATPENSCAKASTGKGE